MRPESFQERPACSTCESCIYIKQLRTYCCYDGEELPSVGYIQPSTIQGDALLAREGLVQFVSNLPKREIKDPRRSICANHEPIQ